MAFTQNYMKLPKKLKNKLLKNDWDKTITGRVIYGIVFIPVIAYQAFKEILIHNQDKP